MLSEDWIPELGDLEYSSHRSSPYLFAKTGITCYEGIKDEVLKRISGMMLPVLDGWFNLFEVNVDVVFVAQATALGFEIHGFHENRCFNTRQSGEILDTFFR